MDETERQILICGGRKVNSKMINTMWSISLIVIGIATILLAGGNIFAIELPDMIVRTLGIIDLASLFVLVFSTVKKAKSKKQN